jgi:hypothetical protein
MSQSPSQTFLAITRNSPDFEWLQGALAGPGFTAIARAFAS